MNEFDKAQEWNNRIAEKKPDVDLAYYNRSRIYMAAGDTLSAIQNLEKVIEINPKNKNAAIRLMKYYEAKNDKEKAAMYRQKAVEASKK
jgi:tetratricopeptide (TPR) repeat protein